MFNDRHDAGKKLALKLERYRGKGAVVLALPRGGVVVGYEIARVLALPLDIIAVRKIGHPASPEYAIGAIDEHGATILNNVETLEIEGRWLAEETERQREEAKRRSALYRGERDPVNITGKTAIIVDDGIATGLTMRLAVRSTKTQRPEKIVIAVPVAPPESIRALHEEGADEVIVLESPEEFLGAVGAHYITFDQVEDNEVVRLMKSASGS
ncbi:MAG: phosphoribosyltransferase family protein [bacterium]|nr:phosphoribosyltransferase family protein [bacterium]